MSLQLICLMQAICALLCIQSYNSTFVPLKADHSTAQLLVCTFVHSARISILCYIKLVYTLCDMLQNVHFVHTSCPFALYSQQVEKIWAKRLQQWKTEKDAHKKLMQDVLEMRKKQIEYKCEFLSLVESVCR